MSVIATGLERLVGGAMTVTEQVAPRFAPWLASSKQLARESTVLEGAVGGAAQAGEAARTIVVQGGLSSNSHAYEPIKRILESRGHRVYVTQLPLHGWASAKSDARALASKVQQALRETESASVTIIGHSKGGISSRWYLQRMGRVEHVDQLITLGTPHNGVQPFATAIAKLSPFMPMPRWLRKAATDRGILTDAGIDLAKLAQWAPAPSAIKELAVDSPLLRDLNGNLPEFMRRAEQVNPTFRMVSVASTLKNPLIHVDGDLLVSTGAARLAEVSPNVSNVVIRSGNHMNIAAQGRVSGSAMRVVEERLGSTASAS